MVLGSLAGLALAFALAGAGPRLPGPGSLPVIVGLAVMCLGTVLRYWSVLTLGRFFTVTVDIGEGHRVVDAGPYAVLRHPSYTGMLVVYLGIGICLDSWLSVAATVVLPALAVLNRIRHEEAVLVRRLGVDYERYRDRTSRLVPGVW
jgi:protein-S-isoprenylcysteine O-methyltransferase Ste14